MSFVDDSFRRFLCAAAGETIVSLIVSSENPVFLDSLFLSSIKEFLKAKDARDDGGECTCLVLVKSKASGMSGWNIFIIMKWTLSQINFFSTF